MLMNMFSALHLMDRSSHAGSPSCVGNNSSSRVLHWRGFHRLNHPQWWSNIHCSVLYCGNKKQVCDVASLVHVDK